MRQHVVFMFSGQGSHYYQMGRGLFEHNLVFQQWMLEGDRILSGMIGVSILDQVYHNNYKKYDPFTRTLYTHPAIFLVEYALAQAVMDSGIGPDRVLGTSVGGFAAAALSGVMTFETALTAVVKQAEAIETLCPSGGMMAILNSPDLFFKNPLFNQNLELAGINFPSHFVVSGKPESLSDIRVFLKEKAITFQLLDVSHGFHSSLIDPAAATYQHFLNTLVLHEPQIPFISCSDTYTLASVSQNYFWEIVRVPVQFQKTIDILEEQEHAPYVYLDLGPSGTLATFVKYNLKNKSSGSKSLFVLNPFKDEVDINEKLLLLR